MTEGETCSLGLFSTTKQANEIKSLLVFPIWKPSPCNCYQTKMRLNCSLYALCYSMLSQWHQRCCCCFIMNCTVCASQFRNARLQHVTIASYILHVALQNTMWLFNRCQVFFRLSILNIVLTVVYHWHFFYHMPLCISHLQDLTAALSLMLSLLLLVWRADRYFASTHTHPLWKSMDHSIYTNCEWEILPLYKYVPNTHAYFKGKSD